MTKYATLNITPRITHISSFEVAGAIAAEDRSRDPFVRALVKAVDSIGGTLTSHECNGGIFFKPYTGADDNRRGKEIVAIVPAQQLEAFEAAINAQGSVKHTYDGVGPNGPARVYTTETAIISKLARNKAFGGSTPARPATTVGGGFPSNFSPNYLGNTNG